MVYQETLAANALGRNVKAGLAYPGEENKPNFNPILTNMGENHIYIHIYALNTAISKQ